MSERGYYVQHVAYIGPSFCCLRKNLWLKSKKVNSLKTKVYLKKTTTTKLKQKRPDENCVDSVIKIGSGQVYVSTTELKNGRRTEIVVTPCYLNRVIRYTLNRTQRPI